MTEAKKPSGPVPALGSSRVIAAQHDYKTWSVTIPHGVQMETILNSGYWRHHVRTFRPKDVIRAFAEDGTWECWLTVIVPEQSGVVVSKLFSAKHNSVEQVSDDEYEVKWISPAVQFAVVNRAGDRIKDGLYPRSQADQFLAQLKSRTA